MLLSVSLASHLYDAANAKERLAKLGVSLEAVAEYPASELCSYNEKPITWDDKLDMCDYTGRTWKNGIAVLGNAWVNCVYTYPDWFGRFNVTADVVIEGAGPCECPSGCSLSFRGECTSGGCSCSRGYSGPDCSSIDCSTQTCSGHGTCKTREGGYGVCDCEAGYSGIDCSAVMGSLPAIEQTVNIPQYSSWDEYKDNNPLFDENSVATINVEMDPEDLAYYMSPLNVHKRDYVKANMTFTNGKISERMLDIGIRPKGGASRYFVKKSWKISVSTFSKGRRWYQQKKISLKASAMTPSYIRERWSRDLFYSMGSPTQRMSYAMLYINGVYRGAYLILEDIGEEFLKSRFGNDEGGLWKCGKGGAKLQYVGDSCSDYRPIFYDPKTAYAEDHCEKLVELITILNEPDDATFIKKVPEILDVDFFMRTLSVEVLTANWDGILNGNNYYMYYDMKDNIPRFKYFRYDLDIAMGFYDETHEMRDGSIFVPGDHRFFNNVTNRLLTVPEFKDIYANYVTMALKGWYDIGPDSSSALVQRYTIMHDSVTPAVQQDYWHHLDQMFSFQEFRQNLAEADVIRPNAVLCEVILDYAKSRIDSAKRQLGL